ncbi:MAG TPA: hypothetical protein VI036_17970 [Propionibacteriaceae bacterium]
MEFPRILAWHRTGCRDLAYGGHQDLIIIGWLYSLRRFLIMDSYDGQA